MLYVLKLIFLWYNLKSDSQQRQPDEKKNDPNYFPNYFRFCIGLHLCTPRQALNVKFLIVLLHEIIFPKLRYKMQVKNVRVSLFGTF